MIPDRATGATRRIRRWLGDSVVHGVGGYSDQLNEINALGPALRDLDDDGLGLRVRALRARTRSGTEPGGSALECFAIVREVAHRTIGLRPYDEQLVAGLALSSGAVVEMQTGEGKTLAAVAPVALAALAGGGAHVLTFNDYLARRDALWMGPVYDYLGLSIGCVQEASTLEDRKRAYDCDITYLTAKEAGFDFLRGFLSLEPEGLLRRGASFALVDEADSILIDEARIPLVIAGSVNGYESSAVRAATVVRHLTSEVDFDTDEYGHNISLTERGAARVEAVLGCGSLYDSGNLELLADLRKALHALHLLERDHDYIVRRDRIELVDENTGRVAENRQWPDGLQAAIEAKENLKLRNEGQILGSITMHHFMRTYPRLCGMTATATPSAEELGDFYDLSVVVVPSHRPCVRIDHEDVVFTHREAKRRALVAEITDVHATGRPVLVGTASVAESEQLAVELEASGVSCRVLNAKNDELEASVIADAGAPGAVTISTNMAGRGTDIRLGGADERHRDRVIALGGLLVIGTNRHESLRIDRQLRGRAGRQGDPGSSRFFVSLEDPLISRYGVDRLISARVLSSHQEAPLESPVLGREIARVQRIIEGESLDIRRRLWEFSAVVESQRFHFQDRRQRILLGEEGLDLLKNLCPERWREVSESHDVDLVEAIERRLTLIVMDRCWSDHLAELARIRDGIHVVGYVGKDPAAEFCREAGEAFADLSDAVDDEIATIFEGLEVGPDGVDWAAQGLTGPSSTWTYLVNDAPFGDNSMRQLASRAGFAAIGAIAAAPVLFVWGLVLHWKRRRLRAKLERRDGDPEQ
jgi:preprotein translocase subunit SecA